MDSVSWLLPGAHISQMEDGAGPLVSPQWSGLPAGAHCHAPLQPRWSPPSGLRRAGGPLPTALGFGSSTRSACGAGGRGHRDRGPGEAQRPHPGVALFPLLRTARRSQSCACAEVERSLLAPLGPSDLGVRWDRALAGP